MRRTKIIATVGPGDQQEAPLRDLIAAGVDVFRLNFSHGSHEAHGEVVARIRALAAAAGRSVALLQDLSGPKIRTGLLRDHAPITLAAGDELVIAVGNFLGAPGRVSDQLRIPAVARQAGRHAAARRRPHPAARRGRRPSADSHRGGGRRRARRAQGHQRAGRPAAGVRSHRQGQGGSGVRRTGRRGFRGHELRAERRRPAPGARRAARRGRAGSCRSSPSWNVPRPSRRSTTSCTRATP